LPIEGTILDYYRDDRSLTDHDVKSALKTLREQFPARRAISRPPHVARRHARRVSGGRDGGG
jgi:hypothetical protein